MSNDRKYSMKVACRKTGLSAHAIRAWERRYEAITPGRDSNNRRYFSEADITRLNLLRRATDAGFQIGQIAGYGDEELRDILGGSNVVELPVGKNPEKPLGISLATADSGENYVESFMSALSQLDTSALENVLYRAETDLGINGMLESVIIPVMEEIGEHWRKGLIRISHEHMASHTVRTFLGGILSSVNPHPSAPGAIVTTPADQWHDVGALVLAVAAASEGWDVTYLGANLPAEEIAGAARTKGAKCVILSIVYPEDDPGLAKELVKLRRALPDNVYIISGGRASAGYGDALEKADAVRVESIYDLRTTLESIRKR